MDRVHVMHQRRGIGGAKAAEAGLVERHRHRPRHLFGLCRAQRVAEMRGKVRARAPVVMAGERRGVGIGHLDRNQPQRAPLFRQQREKRLVAGIEPLHVARLEHKAALRTERVKPHDVRGRITQRLFAEDVQAPLQRRRDMGGMQRVGRGDHHCVQRLRQKRFGIRECRKTVAVGQMRAHHRRRVGDPAQVERVAQPDQVGKMLDLSDRARTDHADPQPVHSRPTRPHVAILVAIWFLA